MALTSESLPGLPKLDKNQFIYSYLQGQKSHAKLHAEEGRSLSTSWVTHSTPKKLHASGIPQQDAKRPSRETSQRKRSSLRKRCPRNEGADSDDDQVARLAERRERKRMKRAIVQPKEPSEPDTASRKKPKVPAGLALMHGFTATNVGKNRITLKPPSNVGVFKKGKASFNAKTKPKPKGHKSKHFSESDFLNSSKKAPEQAVSDSSSDSDSGSTATSVHEVLKPKKAIPQKSRSVKSHTLTRQSEKPSRVESEIWDIESRASEKRRLLGHKSGSISQGSGVQIPETVVMDARIPVWSNRVANATGMDSAKPTSNSEVPDAVAIPSSPSLRPSQSASQIGQLPVKPSHTDVASRYFPAKLQRHPTSPPELATSVPSRHFPAKPQRQPTPPPEPVVHAVEPVYRDPEPSRCFPHKPQGQQTPPEPAGQQAPPELVVHVEPPSFLRHEAESVENYKDSEYFPVSGDFHPPTRFVVPIRTRVFAEQFLTVQAVRLHPQDPYIHSSSLVDPHVTLEDAEDLEHDTWDSNLPDMLAESWELAYGYAEERAHRYSVMGEAVRGDTQLGDYGRPQSEVEWDTNEIDPVLDADGRPYNDEELGTGLTPEYMDAVEDRDGYLGLGREESDFVDLGDEFGAPVSNAGFDTWEEITAKSLYSPECDYFPIGDASVTIDAGADFIADAPNLNGQESFAFPGEPAIPGDYEDMISECTDSYEPRFAQGRALLMGLPLHDFADRTLSAPPPIPSAEVDVAKSLRDHWLPQRL
ncbi:hypothetical protein B0H14DRAFT_2662872 [Mycena olivaceomarginata]|nr:hypothetical protein B0H14DRAFT_2662872 [Mycena olivaceomarginata]